MSSNSKKKTFNIKKDERHHSRKRKLEAFLDLVRKDETTSMPRKKVTKFYDSYKDLKEELRQYQKRDVIDPLFYLTDIGKSALVKFSPNIKSLNSTLPIFKEDLHHLLLKSVIGNLSPYDLKWAKLERPQNVCKTVVIEIDSLSEKDILEMNAELNKNCKLFRYVFEVISSFKHFATELSTMHMAEKFCSETQLALFHPSNIKSSNSKYIEKQVDCVLNDKRGSTEEKIEGPSIPNNTLDEEAENYKNKEEMERRRIWIEKNKEKCQVIKDVDSSDKCLVDVFASNKTNIKEVFNYKVSKLHLLLSPLQLAMENFPLPQSVFAPSKSHGYKYSKKSYTPVTDDSPMFALDCEMCLTTNKVNELTRVAIVNENLETVYETLVKPRAKIINYLTKFSGITKEMLENVTTRLEDVQRDIRNFLPSDAILVGQSLNGDLHALKLIHPYVIDTSIIFNNKGARHRKTSLKNLVLMHLGEVIQDKTKIGHHPVEDSIGAMKLVQIKLQKTLQYGDSILESVAESAESCNLFNENEVGKQENESEIAKDESKSKCSNDGIESKSGKSKTQSSFHEINGAKCQNKKDTDYVQLNPGPNNCSFFEFLTKYFKKACLVGDEDALGKYLIEDSSENVTKIIKSGNKKIVKAMSKNLNDNNLVIGHLQLDAELGEIDEINESIKEVFNNVPHNSLIFLLAGRDGDLYFKHRFCMAVLKDTKK